MVRMVRSTRPEVGIVAMAEVRSIGQNRAVVHLLEYDVGAKMALNPPVAAACRIEPLQVGRIEPVIVVRPGRMSRVGYGIWPLRVRFFRRLKSRMIQVSRNVSYPDMYACEGRFALRKHIRDILSLVSERLDIDLEVVYGNFGWPESLAALQNIRHSNVIPRHMRDCLSHCLELMDLLTFRIMNPNLLAPTWRYPIGWCWAVAFIRQFEALLKQNNQLEQHVFLSVQDLINQTPRGLRSSAGDVRYLSDGRHGLLAGVTTVECCPLGYPQRLPGPIFRLGRFEVVYDYQYTAEGWDELIELQLRIMGGIPFTASVLWFKSYTNIIASEELYMPNDEELQAYALNPISRHLSVHSMLLSGKGTDRNGNSYLEFQDTTFGDVNNGDRGYLRFARYPCPVIEMIVMSL